MIIALQIITRIVHAIHSPKIQRVKPITFHISLLFLIFVYAFLGGLVFNRLEADALARQTEEERKAKAKCVLQALQNASLVADIDESNTTARVLSHCFPAEVDVRSQWSLVTATLYGFGIVTTLGYNRIAPITLAGRLFCVAYGICGIPITMIIIANIGQYLNQFAGATRKSLETYRERRRRSKASITGEDIPESSIELMSVGLLICFLLYVCFGAVLLPLLNGKFDFLNGIYYNFLCLTAIDFGQLVPAKWAFLPITFLYVCLGLAITTIAIDIGSEYMKKLHHIGKAMKNVAQTKIWFGGKTLKVRDLLHAVGKKCGIDPWVIDNMDLENIVERAVAINEGREPPPDLNDDPIPKEPNPPQEDYKDENDNNSKPHEQQPLLSLPPKKQPEMIIRNPTFDTVSHASLDRTPSAEVRPIVPPSFDLCNIVAIDMDLPDDIAEEQALEWESHPGFSRSEALTVPEPPLASPDAIETAGPVVVLQNKPIYDEKEPRKFREKKEKYARDPQKLYETYQEEWDRLEKLSDKKLGQASQGHRRRSVLALGGVVDTSPESGRSSSPTGADGRPLSPVHGMDHRMTSPVREEPRPTSPLSRPTSPPQSGRVVSPPPRDGGRVVSPPRARVVSPSQATQRSRMTNPTVGSSSPRRPSRLTSPPQSTPGSAAGSRESSALRSPTGVRKATESRLKPPMSRGTSKESPTKRK
ncbi:TWK-16 protein [Aphelenchoides avenae]|nr:TWK-16 protein [Aphelenchus avenae]